MYLIIPTPRSGSFHSQCTLSLFGDLVPVTSELVISVVVALPLFNDCNINALFFYPMLFLSYKPLLLNLRLLNCKFVTSSFLKFSKHVKLQAFLTYKKEKLKFALASTPQPRSFSFKPSFKIKGTYFFFSPDPLSSYPFIIISCLPLFIYFFIILDGRSTEQPQACSIVS